MKEYSNNTTPEHGKIFLLRLRPYGRDIREILMYVSALINLHKCNKTLLGSAEYYNNLQTNTIKNKSLIFYQDLCKKITQFCNEKSDLTLENIYTFWLKPVYTFESFSHHSYQDSILVFIFNNEVPSEFFRSMFNDFFQVQFEQKKIQIQPIKLIATTLENLKKHGASEQNNENSLKLYKNLLTQEEDKSCRIL